MTNNDDNVVGLRKPKKQQQAEDDHNIRLKETIDKINRLANEGKVLVVAETADGKHQKLMNYKEVLKNYNDWGFSPGKKDESGEVFYTRYYIPHGTDILMHQDLYKMELRPIDHQATITDMFKDQKDEN